MVIALVNSHRTFDHIYSANASLPTINHGANLHHTTTMQFVEPDTATSTSRLSQEVEKSQDVQGV